jgi:hypothetical protein
VKTVSLGLLVASTLLLLRGAESRVDAEAIASRGTTLHPVILAIPLCVALDSVLPRVASGKLELWLKANAGVVADAFGRVRKWQDQSENGNDALQASSSQQPLLVFPPALGGRPALRFDGQMVAPERGGGHHICIGTYLEGEGKVDVPRAMTAFCVHMLAAASSREFVLWMVGEQNAKLWGECRAAMVTDDLMHFSFWAYDFVTPFAVPTGIYRIRTDRLDEGLNSMEMFDTSAAGKVNFRVPTSNAGTPASGYFVGGLDPNETFSRNFNGDIAELIIYQGALNDADLQVVTDYLQDKYFPTTRLGEAEFQWQLGGTNIAGATNATLVLTNARAMLDVANTQAAMAGAYSVVVSNAAGIVCSSNAVTPVSLSAPSRSQ